MSAVLQELTLNGETARAMKLSGAGSYEVKLDDFVELGTGQLIFSCRFIWDAPAATPGVRPSMFMGLCAEGKGWGSGGSAHAYGTWFFHNNFQIDPFGLTDVGFYTTLNCGSDIAGVQTDATSGYVSWVGRYAKAAGTNPK